MPSPLATFWMVATYWFAQFLPRLALPVIVPMIAQDMRATSQQRAALLSGFFRGYLLTMVVGGVAAQKWGGKRVLTIDLLGFGLSFLALPWAVTRGPRAVSFTLASMGVFFGPLLSATSVVKNNWLPADGAEKAVAQMIMGVGTKAARITAVAATPLLCTPAAGGWRTCVRIYGAMTLAVVAGWQLIVRERPPRSEEQEQEQEKKSASTAEEPKKAKTFELRIFRVRSVQALIAMHVAYNNSDYTILQWAPTYFTEVLGVPAAGVGKYLLIPTVVNMVGTFLFGSLEALLLKQKVLTVLGMRRWSCVGGTVLSAGGMILFSLCRSPLPAALAYTTISLGQGLHHSGFIVNYLEAGGKDTGLLTGVGNTLANLPGVVSPLFAELVVRRYGSWRPFFFTSAIFEVLCCWFFASSVAMRSAREQLEDAEAAL